MRIKESGAVRLYNELYNDIDTVVKLSYQFHSFKVLNKDQRLDVDMVNK